MPRGRPKKTTLIDVTDSDIFRMIACGYTVIPSEEYAAHLEAVERAAYERFVAEFSTRAQIVLGIARQRSVVGND